MKRLLAVVAASGLAAAALSCASNSAPSATSIAPDGFDAAQVPGWTKDDFDFFLHGSMSTEVVPVEVLAAFRKTYPDLFPGSDLSAFGLIDETPGEAPIGFSRREVPHLGGLPSYGLNCASCHVAEIRPADGGAAVRVIGATGHFDAEAFLGAVIVAGFRTQYPENMGRFLFNVLSASDDPRLIVDHRLFPGTFERQKSAVAAAMAEDPSGAKGLAPGAFVDVARADLVVTEWPDADYARTARAYLRLFHNMRAALHIPDQPPAKAPPASGPGRNDAFGLLSMELFNSPVDYAPVKYGLVWNAGSRPWVHWDGNTRSPLGRNVLAALGLGAPLVNGRGEVDMPLVERHTSLTQAIRPPKYPWTVDADAAARGAPIYAARCASCHDVPESDARLHSPDEVGTDPRRARGFDAAHAELFDRFFRDVKVDGFAPPTSPPIRSTGKYFAPSLGGVWARSPYLHNGSVRTMNELLTPPAARAKSFHRGSRVYDPAAMGFTDDGAYVFDTTSPGNGDGGHAYGTDLDAAAKRDLVEYLKTR